MKKGPNQLQSYFEVNPYVAKGDQLWACCLKKSLPNGVSLGFAKPFATVDEWKAYVTINL